MVQSRLKAGEHVELDRVDPKLLRLVLPIRAALRGGRASIVGVGETKQQPDPVLIKALRTAHAMVARDASGLPVLDAAPASPYRRRLVRLAFLAPDLQRAILAGRQPAGLTLGRLMEQTLPLVWAEQTRSFGVPMDA